MSHVDVLLDDLNSDNRVSLLCDIALAKFFSVSNWPSLRDKISSRMIIWIFRPPLKSGKLIVNQADDFKLPIGTLHFLYSNVLHIGYVVSIPKSYNNVEITDTYVAVKSSKAKTAPITKVEQVANVNHIFNNSRLSIYTQNNDLLIAATNKNLINHIS